MKNIPVWLIQLATFPGVIAHEWAHKKFCEWSGVKVHKVIYFRFGNPAGEVTHEAPSTYKQNFLISTGPIIINSILVVVLAFLASNSHIGIWKYIFTMWVAFSIGMHSFPSNYDMGHISMWSKVALDGGGSFMHKLSFPIVSFTSFINKYRVFGIDVVYSLFLIFIGMFLAH